MGLVEIISSYISEEIFPSKFNCDNIDSQGVVMELPGCSSCLSFLLFGAVVASIAMNIF